MIESIFLSIKLLWKLECKILLNTVVGIHGNLVAWFKYDLSFEISRTTASKESYKLRDCSGIELDELNNSIALSVKIAERTLVTFPFLSYCGRAKRIK